MSAGNRVRMYLCSGVLALAIAGIISLGMIFLTDSGRPEVQEAIDGAIRLAQPEADKVKEIDEKPPEQKPEPPQKLLKEFSVRKQSVLSKPTMDFQLPSFSMEINPLLAGGVALPDISPLGGNGFSLDEVDVKPQVLRSIAPEYPHGAKRNRIEGKVIVRLLVNKDGKTEQVSVHSSSPAGAFDEAALSAAKRWMFKPGRYEGNAVATWVFIPFNFELTR